MMLTATEITTKADMDVTYSQLALVYAATDPTTVVICPLLNPQPIPARSEVVSWLDDPSTRAFKVVDAATGALTMFAVHLRGGCTAAWGPVHRTNLRDSTYALADLLSEEGGWKLITGADGWVARTYFEDYMIQDGGPFDVSVTQPGMPVGTTYKSFDTVLWDLVIMPDGAGGYTWSVSFP